MNYSRRDHGLSTKDKRAGKGRKLQRVVFDDLFCCLWFPCKYSCFSDCALVPCIQQPSKAVPVKSYTSSVCVWKELNSPSETKKKKSSPGLPITVIKWKHSRQKCHTTQHSPWPAGRQRSDPHCDRVQNDDVVYCVLKPPS